MATNAEGTVCRRDHVLELMAERSSSETGQRENEPGVAPEVMLADDLVGERGT